MSWLSPKTWATDDTMSASEWNKYVHGNLRHLFNKPGFYYTRDSDFTLTTPEQWYTVDLTQGVGRPYDTGGFGISSSSSRLLIPQDGYYEFGFSAQVEDVALGNSWMARVLVDHYVYADEDYTTDYSFEIGSERGDALGISGVMVHSTALEAVDDGITRGSYVQLELKHSGASAAYCAEVHFWGRWVRSNS